MKKSTLNRRCVAGIGLLLPALSAWAQNAPQAVAQPGVQALPSAAGSMLQTMLALVVVVALIFGFAWVMRRVSPQTSSRGPLKVMGSASVGARERVVLVQFQDEVLVLGVASGQVRLLKTAALPPELPHAPGAPSFLERLRNATQKPS